MKLEIPKQRFNAHSPRMITAQLLAPLIKWTSKGSRADRYGRKVRIAQRMTAAGKKTVTRQMVSMWLHPEIEKRTQPVMGFGVLLLAIGNQLMNEKTKSLN